MWEKLKRRHVVQVGVAYLVVGAGVGGAADVFLPGQVIKETGNRRRSTWPAGEPAMQSNRHHAPAFGMQHVETVFEVLIKLLT